MQLGGHVRPVWLFAAQSLDDPVIDWNGLFCEKWCEGCVSE